MFFFLILSLLSLKASAQMVESVSTETEVQVAEKTAVNTIRFGYFSYDSIFRSLPEYEIAQKNLADLRSKYDAELKRAEDEFNQKYEEFLEAQRDLVPSILQKRQLELQELMEKNMAFKNEARRLLRQAELDAYAPIKKKINDAVRLIGNGHGLAFVLNTDGDACPFIDPNFGMDITENIRTFLK